MNIGKTQKIFLQAATFVAILCTCLNVPARAQSIDYGDLQRMFGEPVTTSATGSPKRVNDVPVDMVIVTADQIRRSGARDIPGILRHVAGVDVAQWTSDSADVSVRGYNQPYSARLLVLIDGRQVYADYYGFTPWSTLPVELAAIRQIEIVKGPSAALFGFNAVGGVINIVTYNPQYDGLNWLSASGGSQNLIGGSAIWTFRPGPNLAMRVMAGGRIDDNFTTMATPNMANGQMENNSTTMAMSNMASGQMEDNSTTMEMPNMAGAKRRHNYRGELGLVGTYRVSEGVQLRLEANHSIAGETQFNPSFTLEDATYHTSAIKAELNVDSPVGLVTLSTFTNWLGETASDEQISQFLVGPSTSSLTNQVTVAQLSDVFTGGPSSTFRVSMEYRHNSAGTVPLAGADVFYDVYSAFAMWDWAVTPHLSISNALRLDDLALGRAGSSPFGYPFVNANWDRSITQLSFNSGLIWKIDDSSTVRLMASRGAQLPNLVSLGALLYYAPPISITGSPYTSPSSVTNYEASWNLSLDDLNGALQLSMFHQETNNILSNAGGAIFTSSGAWLTPGTIGSSHADGFELTLNGEFLEHWRWGLSYRLETVDDHFIPTAQNGMAFVDYERSTPHDLINANLGWSNENWEVDGYARFQSNTTGLELASIGVPGQSPATMPMPIGQYVSLDMRVAYRLESGVTLSLSGQNLGNEKQCQTAAPDIQRRVMAEIAKMF